RNGTAETDLVAALTDALLSKPARHDFGVPRSRDNRVMAAIGG
ncbi:MAG: GTP 3',8-cyclase MoaA, partial [Nitrosomonadales bacterium]|nr:GTP 3',8-cyclase MoaA [Nitrosomonadales bacterium]